MKLTRADKLTLRSMMALACKYEESYIDSLRGCTDAESAKYRRASETNIKKFERVCAKLVGMGPI